jgi:tetratricopeptide (TPR) repeat protein
VRSGFSRRDAARILGISERTLRRWIEAGRLEEPVRDGVTASSLEALAVARAREHLVGTPEAVREAWAAASIHPTLVVRGDAGRTTLDDLGRTFAHAVLVDARTCREAWQVALAVASAVGAPVRRELVNALVESLRAPTWLLIDARGAHPPALRECLATWRAHGVRALLLVDDASRTAWSDTPSLHAEEPRASTPIVEPPEVRDLLDALSLFPNGATTEELAALLGVSDVEVALRLRVPAARAVLRSSRGADRAPRHRVESEARDASRYRARHARLRARWASRATPSELLDRWAELGELVRSAPPKLRLRLAAQCAWAAERILPLEAVDTLLVTALEAEGAEVATLRRLRAMALCARASLHVKRGDEPSARRVVEDALEHAESIGDAKWIASARLRRAELDLRLHRVDARTIGDLEEATVRAASARDRIAAWIFLGNAAIGPGRLADAEMAYTRALAATRRVVAPRERHVALGNLALVAMLDGRPERAVELLPQVLRAHDHEWDRLSALYVALNLAIAHVDLGEHARATETLRDVFRRIGRSGHRAARPAALLTLGFSRLDQTDSESARRTFEAGIRRASEGSFDEGCLRMGLGLALADDPPRAAAEMRRARACLDRAQHRYATVAAAWEAAFFGQPVPPPPVDASSRDAAAIAFAARYADRTANAEPLGRADEPRSVLVRCAARVATGRGHANAVWCAPDGSAFVRDGRRVSLGAKRIPRRLLSALAKAGERGCSLRELYDAGWPGERLPLERVRHRVHAALGVLRRAGLEGRLVLDADGRHRLR